ncbi:hypothetical protein GQX74_002678 [Glossina fuscipes]|nr:hypothetical protein GQX74_002678 [Glossina fuscipes]
MSSNRHRRTRIYGINYDLGERYYKKQLEDLDNKSEYRKPRDVHFDTELPTKDDITSKVSLLPKDDCGNCFSNNKISGIFKDYDINFVYRRKSFINQTRSSIANSVERKRITTRALISEEQSKEELEASNRARATKARLLDLESEMVAINKKNNEREKRKENLRKLLTSSGSDVNM